MKAIKITAYPTKHRPYKPLQKSDVHFTLQKSKVITDKG
jgi:hypothetical protein